MTNVFSLYSTLKDRIGRHEARVATVGLGYVGLPLALTVNEVGFPVTGLDLNEARVSAINAGERVISYFPETRVRDAVATGRFTATGDPAKLADADVILICVPTPLSPSREPDLSYVVRATETVAAQLRPGQLVVLESTVWPGATATVVKPILESRGLRAGDDFFLAFSPEREDPGNASFTTHTIPKIVGADDVRSRDLVDLFYSQIVTRTVPVSSLATAEAVKLAENSFRTVNIALVNEMKVAMEAMGVDIWEVVQAAATKPFGYMPFYPGPGIGGDCIPVSPVYLSWRAKDVGSAMPIIDLARLNNDSAPALIAGRVAIELGRGGVAVKGARVLILGIAYKKNVEDTRESPALAILTELEEMGAVCDYHDPYFPVMPQTRDHPSLAGRQSVVLSIDAVAGYDAVLVATDHSNVDYGLVASSAQLILDTRNVFATLSLAENCGRLIKI
ncbi:nucleotide sugar dehydrogenase [Defluviimonas aestuarii]|uniref:nucleotide sugar dehydrogenase n=1 Tax=Albidovulum aestuarii TaxID=1130726 RepID=UPI00249CDA74|nr:nucleotide sugar dehydrogenase [Defluviimonas aestuarii]MDI3337087.1 nucleotide sugar dehydrogenase [Defluviimonas aestuarii]